MTVYELIRCASQLPPNAKVDICHNPTDFRYSQPARDAVPDYSRLVIVIDAVTVPAKTPNPPAEESA